MMIIISSEGERKAAHQMPDWTSANRNKVKVLHSRKELSMEPSSMTSKPADGTIQ
jgi:hypothetical protein